jgi:hypothetical protein
MVRKLRTPLEGIDLAADIVNRAATLPGAVIGDMANAAGSAVKNIQAEIAAPREQPERPIPPAELLKPIPGAVADAVGGAINTVKAGVNAAVQNVEGARQEIDGFVRG